MTFARITSKGQVTIPKEVRDRLGVEAGDSLAFEFDGDRLEVRAVKRRRFSDFLGRFPVDRPLPFEEERSRGRASAWGDEVAEPRA